MLESRSGLKINVIKLADKVVSREEFSLRRAYGFWDIFFLAVLVQWFFENMLKIGYQ
jgi:hypothetical protein